MTASITLHFALNELLLLKFQLLPTFTIFADAISNLKREVGDLRDIVEKQTILIQHLITRDNPAEAAEAVTSLLTKPTESIEEFEALEKKCSEDQQFRLRLVSVLDLLMLMGTKFPVLNFFVMHDSSL